MPVMNPRLWFLVFACLFLGRSSQWPSEPLAWAQLIGRPQTTSPTDTDASERMANFLSKVAERITTEELNLKRAVCQEQVLIEPTFGPMVSTQKQRLDYTMTGELKQQGQFSSDVFFVETHAPVRGKEVHDKTPEPLLVKDSFSAAPEFLGMNHREVYTSQFVGKERLEGREVLVSSFQTTPRFETRKITLEGSSVPMRLAGKVWIDAQSGALLKIEVRQTKLPRGVREFSYSIQYASSSGGSAGFTLPASVRFVRALRNETILTTQTFSNCRVNELF